MKIRFKQSLAGERFAFMAGRVYDVPRLTPAFLSYLRNGYAEVVREEPQESLAVPVMVPEMAALHVPSRVGRRRR